MNDSGAVHAGVAIVTGFIMLALVSAILSKNAQTTNVIKAFSDLISNSLKAATGPITSGIGG